MKHDHLELCLLFDFYGEMLTDKQRELFDLYYNEDLSLSEIAEHAGITRQGVRDAVVRAEHTLTALEGDDDMPAHAKSTLAGVSLTIPITAGRLNLGLWQGVYLCEFRNHGGARRIVATVVG